jgi:hypothetical protein
MRWVIVIPEPPNAFASALYTPPRFGDSIDASSCRALTIDSALAGLVLPGSPGTELQNVLLAIQKKSDFKTLAFHAGPNVDIRNYPNHRAFTSIVDYPSGLILTPERAEAGAWGVKHSEVLQDRRPKVKHKGTLCGVCPRSLRQR